MSKPYELFAACLPGLEGLAEAELRALGGLDTKAVRGGVELRGHRQVIYRANLECGLISQLLLRVGSFEARSFPALRAMAGRVEWESFLKPGVGWRVRASARRSKMRHTGAIEQVFSEEIAKRLRDQTASSEDGVPLLVRIEDDVCQVSLDTSGAPLHRRGYRLSSGKAPLREDLARALVIASGWDRRSPLVDPLCGSGTVLIEAALLARGLPPGFGRGFAFTDTRLYHAPTWAAVRGAARDSALAASPAPLFGSDRDKGAIESSLENAGRAGCADDLSLDCAALKARDWAGPAASAEGRIVTNPPWGGRLGKGGDLRPLYSSLGACLRALPEAWRVALLATDHRLSGSTGALSCAFLTDAGGTKVRAMVGR